MAKLYFVCGFIGSGKTTYSKKLAESEDAFRSSDQTPTEPPLL